MESLKYTLILGAGVTGIAILVTAIAPAPPEAPNTSVDISGLERAVADLQDACVPPAPPDVCLNGGIRVDSLWRVCPHPDHTARVFDTAEHLYLLCECPGPAPILLPPEY